MLAVPARCWSTIPLRWVWRGLNPPKTSAVPFTAAACSPGRLEGPAAQGRQFQGGLGGPADLVHQGDPAAPGGQQVQPERIRADLHIEQYINMHGRGRRKPAALPAARMSV